MAGERVLELSPRAGPGPFMGWRRPEGHSPRRALRRELYLLARHLRLLLAVWVRVCWAMALSGSPSFTPWSVTAVRKPRVPHGRISSPGAIVSLVKAGRSHRWHLPESLGFESPKPQPGIGRLVQGPVGTVVAAHTARPHRRHRRSRPGRGPLCLRGDDADDQERHRGDRGGPPRLGLRLCRRLRPRPASRS